MLLSHFNRGARVLEDVAVRYHGLYRMQGALARRDASGDRE